MAEISQDGGGGGRHKGGKPKGKKMSTHIDMTPMVDLAFLLLTFFMLATSFSRPQSMEIVMPEKIKDPKADLPKANWQDVFNLVLGPKDRIYYYYLNPESQTPPDVKVTNFSATGIRKILTDEREKDKQRNGGKDKFIVLIKSDEGARYKNIVDIFDEMNITNMKQYALVDLSPQEKKVIPKE